MKIIIDYNGVKRIIEGPFSICATRGDFMALREQLSEGCMEDHSYGWVTIRTHENNPSINTQPIDWHSKA